MSQAHPYDHIKLRFQNLILLLSPIRMHSIAKTAVGPESDEYEKSH